MRTAIEPTTGPLWKRYIFWTYERGSFHYDVMVTLILLFIFVSPHIINFGDRPKPEPQVTGRDVLVESSSAGVFVYEVSAGAVKSVMNDQDALKQALISSIAPIAGQLQLDRYDTLKDPNGSIAAYRVFAHRTAETGVQ